MQLADIILENAVES